MIRFARIVCLIWALLCLCARELLAQPLDNVNLPPGFSINVFTNTTPKARSLTISGGNHTIVYVSNDLVVRPLLLTPLCS